MRKVLIFLFVSPHRHPIYIPITNSNVPSAHTALHQMWTHIFHTHTHNTLNTAVGFDLPGSQIVVAHRATSSIVKPPNWLIIRHYIRRANAARRHRWSNNSPPISLAHRVIYILYSPHCPAYYVHFHTTAHTKSNVVKFTCPTQVHCKTLSINICIISALALVALRGDAVGKMAN